ncbi:MAG: hypothetical protein AB1486_29875 [Planctomycetota bacterium]
MKRVVAVALGLALWSVLTIRHLDRPYVGAFDLAAVEQALFGLNHVRYGVAHTLLAPCRGVTEVPSTRPHVNSTSPRLLPALGALAALAPGPPLENVRWVSFIAALTASLLLLRLLPSRLGFAGRFVAFVLLLSMPAVAYFARVPVPEVVLTVLVLAILVAHRSFMRQPMPARGGVLGAACALGVWSGCAALAAAILSALHILIAGRSSVGRWRSLYPLGGALVALAVWCAQNALLAGPAAGFAMFQPGTLLSAQGASLLQERLSSHAETVFGLGAAVLACAAVPLLLLDRKVRAGSMPLLLLVVTGLTHLLLESRAPTHHSLLLIPLAPAVAWGAAEVVVWAARSLKPLHLDLLPYLLIATTILPMHWRAAEELAGKVSGEAVGDIEAGRKIQELTGTSDEIVTPATERRLLMEVTAARKIHYGIRSPRQAWTATRARSRGVGLWLAYPVPLLAEPEGLAPSRARFGNWTSTIEGREVKAGRYLVCRLLDTP